MNHRVAAQVLTVAILLAGCGGGSREAGDSEMSDFDLAGFGQETGLAFPAGTEVLTTRGVAGIDDAQYVKLRIPAADWPSFLASSPLAEEEFVDENRYLLGPDEGAWDPSTVGTLPTAQFVTGEGRALNLGYDDSAGDTVTAYVMWHGT